LDVRNEIIFNLWIQNDLNKDNIGYVKFHLSEMANNSSIDVYEKIEFKTKKRLSKKCRCTTDSKIVQSSLSN